MEESDGIRFSWNVWPTTRIEQTRFVVPMGCLYSPTKQLANMPDALEYDPIRCKQCAAVLNPYCSVDFVGKLWSCPYCATRNHFPPHYAQNISEQFLPAELMPQNTTVEYELPNRHSGPPVFVFVLDTCVSEEELDELKDSLQQTLNFLPEEARVGLVTFGTVVQVHEIGFADCPKSYAFRGTKDYSAADVKTMLGLQVADVRNREVSQQQAADRFLLPISECGFNLESVLEDLQKDPWPVQSDHRPQRCTGTALSVAIGLLESTYHRQGARVMLFVGGPPTIGPGAIVGPARSEDLRSHTDIEKGRAPMMKAAVAHYDGLADRAVAANHVVDVFACSLDQIGVLEMKSCMTRTGGLVVLADSFGQSVFKESFRRVFRRFPDDAQPKNAGNLAMAFAATLEVLCSKEFKIAGAIGPCSAIKRTNKTTGISDTEVGQGGTNAWSMGGLFPSSTVALYFDISNPNANLPPGYNRHLQLITQYQHSSGKYRMRVTSICAPWHSDPANSAPITAGFDQEAAAVLVARYAVHRAEGKGSGGEDTGELMRWLDRALIRLCSKVATYQKGQPDSFRLTPEFSIYPQFMFNLRRSNFLQVRREPTGGMFNLRLAALRRPRRLAAVAFAVGHRPLARPGTGSHWLTVHAPGGAGAGVCVVCVALVTRAPITRPVSHAPGCSRLTLCDASLRFALRPPMYSPRTPDAHPDAPNTPCTRRSSAAPPTRPCTSAPSS
jgi:protein transport protein SEC23